MIKNRGFFENDGCRLHEKCESGECQARRGALFLLSPRRRTFELGQRSVSECRH